MDSKNYNFDPITGQPLQTSGHGAANGATGNAAPGGAPKVGGAPAGGNMGAMNGGTTVGVGGAGGGNMGGAAMPPAPAGVGANAGGGAGGHGGMLNFFAYLGVALVKPVKCFQQEREKLGNWKNSLILSLIVTVVMLVVKVVETIISTVRVESLSSLFGSGGGGVQWEWENMKLINWGETLGKNFLIYAGAILVIAGVFYLAGLVAKKQTNFMRMMSIVATAGVPVVLGMIIAPLVGMMWSPLSVVVSIIAMVYAVVILYELTDAELQLEGDKKVYFYFICFSIIAVALYFVYTRLMLVGSLSSGLNSLKDLLD